jgi:UDP-4-amino-4,6-dideoxy-N-acetyl-beta-L-altrosamine N-acetyltransferase
MKREDYQLRCLDKNDLDMVLKWRNSDRIRQNMYTDQIISLEKHLDWFDNIKQNQSCMYLICEFQNNPIGLISFTEIDLINKKSYWAFYLGDIDAPKGSGAVMEFLALEYAFKLINIRKLCCEVFVFNNSVVKLHGKFGFQQESYFKEHILKNDKYEDVIGMAIFKSDWELKKLDISKIVFR